MTGERRSDVLKLFKVAIGKPKCQCGHAYGEHTDRAYCRYYLRDLGCQCSFYQADHVCPVASP